MAHPRFGVEYTFVHPRYDEDRYFYRDAVDKLQKIAPKTFRLAHVDGMDDGHHLEVPSPPHSSLEEAKEFYDRMVGIVSSYGKYGLVARRVDRLASGDVYYGTGGGHVHVELPRNPVLRRRVMLCLVKMTANRPWLNWVFNEFMDDHNANALAGRESVLKLMQGESKLSDHCSGFMCDTFMKEDVDPREQALFDLVGSNRSIAFKRWSRNVVTVEFRVFDAPRSWEQARKQIEFALRFYELALQRVKDDVKVDSFVSKPSQLRAMKARRRVLKEFRETVRDLGLRWADYRRYMVNYDDRKRSRVALS
jgi:hypothetical protein